MSVELLPIEAVSSVVMDATEIPCRRVERGGIHAPAKWAAWIVEVGVCCNPPIPPHEQPIFVCDPCLESWRAKGITCPHCGTLAGSFAEIVTHVERIGA